MLKCILDEILKVSNTKGLVVQKPSWAAKYTLARYGRIFLKKDHSS